MSNVLPINRKQVDSYWQDVWMKFKNGDIKAFELVYNGHVDFLYSYGTKMTVDTELVEDAIQDLFLYLLSRKENLSYPNYIRYYLLKAFKRILLEKIKKENIWVKGSDEISFDFSIDLDSALIKERKLELIEELVDQLDSQKKEIIFLKFHSGLNYNEIAGIVGIQPTSVKKMVYRIISSFREVLKDKVLELLFIFSKLSRVQFLR